MMEIDWAKDERSDAPSRLRLHTAPPDADDELRLRNLLILDENGNLEEVGQEERYGSP